MPPPHRRRRRRPAALAASSSTPPTAFAIPGVEVGVNGRKTKTTTDASGRFLFDSLPVGNYTLSLRHQGYQPALSESILVGAAVVKVTLSMQRGANDLQVIAVTFDAS